MDIESENRSIQEIFSMNVEFISDNSYWLEKKYRPSAEINILSIFDPKNVDWCWMVCGGGTPPDGYQLSTNCQQI